MNFLGLLICFDGCCLFVQQVCGVLLLAFGILGAANPRALTQFLNGIPGVVHTSEIINIPETIVASSVFMIILGSVMLVFGFLGCAGAWCMVKWMLFIVSINCSFPLSIFSLFNGHLFYLFSILN